MTKPTRIAAVIAIALAATAAVAQSDAQKSFTQLKSLTGSSEGESPQTALSAASLLQQPAEGSTLSVKSTASTQTI